MGKLYPIQHSFSAGEISPQLIARTDLEGYSKSAKTMVNMIPSIQGPAKSRPGLEFISEAEAGTEQYARMLGFHVSFVESYVIIITIEWIYIADLAGFLPENNLFTNSRFAGGATDWTTFEPGGADVVFLASACRLEPSGVNDASIRQLVTTDIAEIAAEHVVGYRGLSNAPCRVMIGAAPNGTEILDTVLAGVNATAVFTPGIQTFWVEFRATADDPDKILDSVACFNPVTAGDPALTRFPSPYISEEIVELIQYEMVPGEKTMYLFQRDTPPQFVTYLGDHVWESGPIVFDGGEGGTEPPPWQPEVEHLDVIHPGSVAFHKGRMYVGGTLINNEGIWASVPGEYLQFILPTGDPEDSDPMYLPIDTAGDISWMLGAKALFVGMDTGEHIIFGENNAIPTPANVDTEQQSAYGSSRVQAVKIGEQVAFVTADRRKLYLTSYNRDSLGWIGDDVSYPSEHITAGLLREIDLSNSGDQALWMPTFSGEVVSMSYDARRKIVGWHRHVTDGFIVSSTVVKIRGRAVLWIAVLRGADPEDQRLYFERTSLPQMDSHLVKTVITATDTFDGFDHLEGRTVQVLTDGAVHRDLVVGESGTVGRIVIDYTAFELIAGLAFLPVLETLPVDLLGQSQSIASYKKGWNQIYIKLLNSTRPKINGIRPPVRNEETLMNEPETRRTEDLAVANLGWDLDASVRIEQDLPLVLEVAGIFGELDTQNISDD